MGLGESPATCKRSDRGHVSSSKKYEINKLAFPVWRED